jgi:DNA-3-methyladenine glycosylase II
MEFTLKPVAPFDLGLSAGIFSDGDRRIRRYEDGNYWQVLRINGKLVLVVIRASGTVEEPRLSVKLSSNKKLSSIDRKTAEESVHSLFNLGLDLKPFYEEVRKDEVINRITRRLRGLRSPTTPTVFEALIDSIIEQQISLNVAHSLEKNVVESFGDILKLDGDIYHSYPTPRKLASLNTEQLRRCGLSLRKAEYVKEISKLVTDGKVNLEKFKEYEDAKEIVDELDKMRGVGVWTAELTMIRGMQRFDAIPADDLGVRRCVSHYYCNDQDMSGEEVRKIAERWGRWKGLACFYLIVAERLGIEA